jgi:antitoxin component HigA of HigAB toxin-antitoxin module
VFVNTATSGSVERTIMWGWGRNSKDDDSSSAGNNNTTSNNSTNSKGFGIALSSPRSPMSVGGGGSKKHSGVFSGTNFKSGRQSENHPYGARQQHQRRRSWTAGKERQSGVRVASASGVANINGVSSANSAAGDVLSAVTIMEKVSSTYSTEGYSGIEVSLSHDKISQQQSHNQQQRSGVVAPSTLPTSGAMGSTITPKSPFNLAASFATAFHHQRSSANTPAGGGGGAIGIAIGSSTLAPPSSMSVQRHISERQKVYRAQFQSAQPPLSLGPTSATGSATAPVPGASNVVAASALSSDTGDCGPASPRSLGTTKSSIDVKRFSQSNDHRLPLFTSNFSSSKVSSTIRYDDALAQLKDYVVRDEIDCVSYELEQTEKEIAAIEKDRQELERYWMSNESNGVESGSKSINATILTNSISSTSNSEWDINRTLATKKNLSLDRIKELHAERGLCVTISIENTKALEYLLSKCGGKATTISTNKSWESNGRQQVLESPLVTTLRPSTGSDSGAGSTIQQICLLKSPGHDTSLFISRDSAHSIHYGRLPDRLFRRMRNRTNGASGSAFLGHPVNNYNSNNDHALLADYKDILYLSTGPFGCYYSEFRSGECWWGLTSDDDELDMMLNEWDVYKIAFGPCVTIEQANGRSYKSTSWILIARDGRAAWKNLPSRLHNKLSSRLANETSPVDISLGCEGSYFIRFLDGKSMAVIGKGKRHLPKRPKIVFYFQMSI